MTAGKDAPASHELGHVAQRLASFAAGCLGTSSPAKTGSRLGVMGNVSEAELREILHHIEVLSKQRAAGQAGQSSGYPESTSETDRPGSSFQQALKEACGVDAEHLHLYLPRDAGGKVDLLQIFRMENGKATAEAPAKYVDSCGGCDALADYVDHPSDLPKVTPDELPKLGLEVDPAQWLQDTVAINALRSAIFHKVAAEVEDRLLPISKRCRSRRPALCKTALRAMAELADADLPSAAWSAANGAEMTEACLGAMQVTKVTAKLGEETLDAVCRRLQAEGTTGEVLQVLCQLQCPEVRHPACVAAMLRVMGTCLGRASSANLPSDRLGLDCLDVVSEFCEEIMKNRRLSPAFSEARAVQRLLAERRG